MIVASVLTSWCGSGVFGDSIRPLLATCFDLFGWVDVVGIPGDELVPDVNLVEIQVICSPETLAVIEADPRFFVLVNYEEG